MGFFDWFRDHLGFPPLSGEEEGRRTYRGLGRLTGQGLDNAAQVAVAAANEFTAQTCTPGGLEGHGQERGVTKPNPAGSLAAWGGWTYPATLTNSHCAWLDGDSYLDLSAVPPTWLNGDYTVLLGLAPELLGRAARLVDLTTDGRLVVQLDLEADGRPAIRTLDHGLVYQPALTAGAETELALVRRDGVHSLVLAGSTAAEAGEAPAGEAEARPPAAGRLYRGRLWLVGLYARALSEAQIRAYFSGAISTEALTACWPLAEGAGQPWDVSGLGRHAGLVTGSDPWTQRQNSYHHNLSRGFRLVSGTKVPALVDGSGLAADGGALTNPPGPYHNGAETALDHSAAWRTDIVAARRFHSAAGRRTGYEAAIRRVTATPFSLTFFNRDVLRVGQPFSSGPVGGGDKSAFTVRVDFRDQLSADELAAVEASVDDTGRAMRDQVVYVQPPEALGYLRCGGTFAAPVRNQ